MHSWRKAAWCGFLGSRERMSWAYGTWCGQSMCRAWAVRRRRPTAPSGAAGRVRRMPVAGGEHEVGGGHAGEQGDLGVPAVGGERGAVAELVAAVAFGDLLFRDVEGDAAAFGLQLFAQAPDVAQQRHGFLGAAVVDGPLHAFVVELGAAADGGAGHAGGHGAPLGVEVERPQDGGAGLAGEQAGGALAEHGGVQGDLFVGEVERGDAAVGLGVEGAAGRDVRGDVGDGVADPVAAVAAREVHRLVEVDGGRWVDREEGDVGGVPAARFRRVRGRRGSFRLREGVGREGPGDVQGRTQFTQCGTQRGLGCAGHTEMTAGHAPSVGRGGDVGTP